MEPEDGLIWVLSFGDESLMAFTDDGVDSLVDPPGNEAPQGVLISASSATPRGPCRTVTVPEDGEPAIELVGELAGILAVTQEKSPRPFGPGARQVTLVAGARIGRDRHSLMAQI